MTPKPTVREWAAEVSRLTEAIDRRLRERYSVALAWRQANPLSPIPGYLYGQLADYTKTVNDVRRTIGLTPMGEIRALKAILERVTT